MSTIHNPVNFNPQDYSVVAYLDNKPPVPPPAGAFGMGYAGACAQWQEMLEAWRAEIARLNVQGGIHKCCHCGNGMVRYVAICLHAPTGRNVCFGSDCVERLALPGVDAFKALHIRTHAANEAARMARLGKMAETLTNNPGLADAFKNASPKNSFVADVFRKLEQYGELSEKQVSAVLASVQRDADYAARKAAELATLGPIPTGKRIEFSGVIVSRRVDDGPFGMVVKCLIKLDNGGKIWGTQPGDITSNADVWPVHQTRVTIRATVEAKPGEPSFGFMNRPHLIKAELIGQKA